MSKILQGGHGQQAGDYVQSVLDFTFFEDRVTELTALIACRFSSFFAARDLAISAADDVPEKPVNTGYVHIHQPRFEP